MQLKIDPNTFFVFDLDDTIFLELDYLKSAYFHISSQLSPRINCDIYEDMLDKYHRKENVFQWVVNEFNQLAPDLNLQWLLKEYREHAPVITLTESTREFLEEVRQKNIPTGLVTDGRSITQRNKLKALGLENYFSDIIISEEFGSEKPDERNYLYFEKKYPGMKFCLFADNTSKDFIVPAKLGWTTICIKNAGHHIHQQTFDKAPVPDFIISGFNEIELM